MDERKELGNRGENAVAAALAQRGFEVLERQYRCRWGEIDLIARAPDRVLCFVEVKARSIGAIASPRESVTKSKQRKLRNTAGWYLAQKGLDCPCRFDVAEVYPDTAEGWERPRIHYITCAFQ